MNLKICGMQDRQNILNVAKTLPDYMGFIFYAKSPRYVGRSFEMPDISREIKKVGVFVNEEPSIIKQIINHYKLDFIQLHGVESVIECSGLKDIACVIKAFSVDDDFDFNRTKPYIDKVDFFLFDTKGKYYGGNGKTFNWRKLEEYNQEVPFFLSGGLTTENLDQLHLLKNMNIHGVDVNSGVEIRPGLKDVQKIKTFNSKLNRHELQG